MKRKNDRRHLKRIKLMQALFAKSFQNTQDSRNKTLARIKKLFSQIDAIIEKAAPQFPIEKIAKIDLAILRLAVFELVFERREPPKVIIDEAIELAKEFAGEGSPSFINGALATIYKEIKK